VKNTEETLSVGKEFEYMDREWVPP
jgi:hypothetical protein